MTQQEFNRLTTLTQQLLKIAGDIEDAGDAVNSQRLAKLVVEYSILALNNDRDTEQEIAGRLLNKLEAANV